MLVKLIKMQETSRAYRFLGQTGTLNITNGTFIFVAENGMFLSGTILDKDFSGKYIEIQNENNVFTFELI